ncbi:zinc-binding dehydrogenase [Conexibacter sp. CPCC 206217]|uniref:zinc-binding dehydrogenase n=1 Tax=Conexibacter sp. CPCC 206217 TaxID=3064574 RepID=UPI00271FEE49|nr:zinc-binding dehydrogenase [Conexibacter sp. CPCC 206217]MDO8209014.1 zinc-binding dehydrogenase [Conexibacter sp. CPCC 206217]
MHAIRLHAFGPPENLVYEQVDDPQPAAGQVRIAVGAAGVHLLDTSLRAGQGGPPLPLPALPHIPGREVAGVVDALGPGVAREWLGRRVVAHLGREPVVGGYAGATVAAADGLHAVPEALDSERAVAMIGTGRTALAVLEVAQLRADDVVLVTAAAGGIGTLLLQAARNVDALVVGVAGGPEKVARVRALGAAVAIDYQQPDWAEQVREQLGDYALTVAFDGVGGALGRSAMQLLAPGGRLILYGWSSGTATEVTTDDLYAGGLTVSAAVGPAISRRPGGLRGLERDALAAAASGALVPAVQTFPLAEAAAAHTALERRATRGKVVLVP